ncbi:MAG TPA: hypothetical protein VGG63_02360 [Steroidobacteraceae bacterium]|jgi:hydrogenase-4 component E
MLAAHLPPLAGSLFSLLAITSLLLAFAMLGSRWLYEYMIAFAVQSWLIAFLSAAVAYYGGYRRSEIIETSGTPLRRRPAAAQTSFA